VEALAHIARRLAVTEATEDSSTPGGRPCTKGVTLGFPASLQRRVLRVPEVTSRTGLSRTTIWRLVRAKEFPRPYRLSPNTVGWSEDDVIRWLAARVLARPDA